MKSREYAGCVFKTAPQPADLAILSLRCDFLFLSSMCPGGAGTAGTVAAGPDHTCYIEQKLQNIGGRSGKETCQEQLCASLQYRCDNIKDKQYCAERMQFHCVFHFRFHYQVLLSQDDQLRVFTLLSSFIYGFLLPYETSIKNKVSEKTDSRIQRSLVNCTFFCKFFSTTTLEIWQLLLQTYIVKLSGFLRRSRNSFSFFSRSPINPNRKRSQGRRAQACLYAVSDPDYPWLREVKDSITPFHAAKGFLFCTSLSSA